MTQPPSDTPLSSPHSFFETWLPARFAEFVQTCSPGQLQFNARCSVHVEVGAEAWHLSLRDNALDVRAVTVGNADEATFRVHVDPALFDRFVLAEATKVTSVPKELPALKLLALDDEALTLIRDIPGCLKVVATEPGAELSATFGPGSRPAEPAECTLKCSVADLEAVKAGQAQPMELFFSGRIQLEGDAQVAMALAGLFL